MFNNLEYEILKTTIQHGNSKELQRQLDAGISPNANNFDGRTALMLAVKSNQVQLARTLLWNGADVDQADTNGDTPLIWASCLGDVEMVSLLLDYAADVDVKNCYGTTPLDGAQRIGNDKIVNMLLSKKGDGTPLQPKGINSQSTVDNITEKTSNIQQLALRAANIDADLKKHALTASKEVYSADDTEFNLLREKTGKASLRLAEIYDIAKNELSCKAHFNTLAENTGVNPEDYMAQTLFGTEIVALANHVVEIDIYWKKVKEDRNNKVSEQTDRIKETLTHFQGSPHKPA